MNHDAEGVVSLAADNVNLRVEVPRDLWKRVKRLAVEEETTTRALVIEALEKLLREREK